MSSGGGSHGGGDSGSGDSGSENTETVCDDGLDNDGDGDTDDADSDCASTPPANPDCDDSYVLYSGHPDHISYTNQEAADGTAGDWVLLDPADWPDYNHPAYYYSVNGERDVLDCTQDDSVSGWTLQAPSSGGGSHGGGDSGSDDDSSNANPTCDDSYVLYGGNANQHVSYTQQDVIDGNAPDWSLLDPNQILIIITLHTITLQVFILVTMC